MDYIKYPIAKTLIECIEHLKKAESFGRN